MTAISSDRGFEASGTRYAELASALVKEIVGGSLVVAAYCRLSTNWRNATV
jgi:hypothetical protein